MFGQDVCLITPGDILAFFSSCFSTFWPYSVVVGCICIQGLMCSLHVFIQSKCESSGFSKNLFFRGKLLWLLSLCSQFLSFQIFSIWTESGAENRSFVQQNVSSWWKFKFEMMTPLLISSIVFTNSSHSFLVCLIFYNPIAWTVDKDWNSILTSTHL